MKRKIAITGSTGGLGSILSEDLARLGHELIFVDRNPKKSQKNADRIRANVPDAKIAFVQCDLASDESVRAAAKELSVLQPDTLILGSGIYNVPIFKCESGFNNVFQVNFLSQYRLAKFLTEECAELKKIVAIGSVAYRYGKFDASDPDYSSRKRSSEIYGNSKRVLTVALNEHFKDDKRVKLSVAHPGVTLTNMTNHYPKAINWLVKIGIKIFFPSPKNAVRSIVRAVEDDCGYLEWIGPSVFDVWGKPKKSKMKGIEQAEILAISEFIKNSQLEIRNSQLLSSDF